MYLHTCVAESDELSEKMLYTSYGTTMSCNQLLLILLRTYVFARVHLARCRHSHVHASNWLRVLACVYLLRMCSCRQCVCVCIRMYIRTYVCAYFKCSMLHVAHRKLQEQLHCDNSENEAKKLEEEVRNLQLSKQNLRWASGN